MCSSRRACFRGAASDATAKDIYDNEFDLQRGQLEDHHQSTFVTLKNDATLAPLAAQSPEVRRDREARARAVRRRRLVRHPVRDLRARRTAARGASLRSRATARQLSSTPTSPIACGISERLVVEAGLRAGSESYTPDGIASRSSTQRRVDSLAADIVARRVGTCSISRRRIHELQVEDGVTEYQPAQRSEHRVLGIEHSFRRGVEARLELYDKTLTHLRPRFLNLYDHLLIFPELRADRIAHRARTRPRARSGAARSLRLRRNRSAAGSVTRSPASPITVDRPRRAARLGPAPRHDLQRELPARPEMELQPGRHVAQRLADHARARARRRHAARSPSSARAPRPASPTTSASTFAPAAPPAHSASFVELFNVLGSRNVTRVNTFEFRQDASGEVTAIAGHGKRDRSPAVVRRDVAVLSNPSSAFGTFSPQAGRRLSRGMCVESLLPSARGEGAEGG